MLRSVWCAASVVWALPACMPGTGAVEDDTADNLTDPADEGTDVVDTEPDPSDDPVVEVPDGLPDPDDGAGWPAAWRSYADQVFTLTNNRRASRQNCGSEGSFEAAPALARDATLELAARRHTVWMAGEYQVGATKLSHESPGGPWGETMVERAENAGYDWRALGENVAWNSVTPEDVVSGWMRSPGHCANIMNPQFTEIGIAYVQTDDSQTWWTQDFGRSR